MHMVSLDVCRQKFQEGSLQEEARLMTGRKESEHPGQEVGRLHFASQGQVPNCLVQA